MATYSPMRFSQPEFLKSIHPERLIALLDPHREFFKKQGMLLPERSPDLASDAVDYDGLVTLFMTPDTEFPFELRDALYLINEMSTPEAMDALLADLAAKGARLDHRADRSPGDVAVDVWLTDPDLLQREHAQMCLLVRPRSYTTFRLRAAPAQDFAAPGVALIRRLEADLGHAFDQMGRSPACRILMFPQGDEVWFLVGHGDPYRREGSLAAGRSTQVFYRPERFDVVVYRISTGELRANARSKNEIELFRDQFGLHLFGDVHSLQRGEFYTLAPLAESPDKCQASSDIAGMDWVKLVEIKFWSRGDPSIKVTWWSDNLVFAMAQRKWRIPPLKRLISAKFHVKYHDSKSPRSVTITPPDKTSYTHDDDSECVEEWLRERHFITESRSDSHAAS